MIKLLNSGEGQGWIVELVQSCSKDDGNENWNKKVEQGGERYWDNW